MHLERWNSAKYIDQPSPFSKYGPEYECLIYRMQNSRCLPGGHIGYWIVLRLLLQYTARCQQKIHSLWSEMQNSRCLPGSHIGYRIVLKINRALISMTTSSPGMIWNASAAVVETN
jgi:hypothetical protein